MLRKCAVRLINQVEMKPQRLLLSVLLVASLIIALVFIVIMDRLNYPIRSRSTAVNKMRNKSILLWNKFFSQPFFNFGEGHEPFLTHSCAQANCFTSADRSLLPLEEWDAIVFHGVQLNGTDMPSRRSWSQRYVFYLLESPSMTWSDLKLYNNFFNWTVTYRSDSDIHQPYNRIYPRSSSSDPSTWSVTRWLPETLYDGPNIASGKDRMAAIFVSHCRTHSKRELLVDELSRYIEVHAYGRCGNMSCPRTNEKHCREMLDKRYKFYLAFENSLCDEYVTEKFFHTMNLNVIPVVYGGADYSKVAPPRSYIDARSFPTVKHLAEYLIRLGKNDSMYNQYFWWKKHYKVGAPVGTDRFCRLCDMLHTNVQSSVYEDMHDWWIRKGNCIVHNYHK